MVAAAQRTFGRPQQRTFGRTQPISLPQAHFNHRPCQARLYKDRIDLWVNPWTEALTIPFQKIANVTSKALPGNGERLEFNYNHARVSLVVPFAQRWIVANLTE